MKNVKGRKERKIPIEMTRKKDRSNNIMRKLNEEVWKDRRNK